MKNVLILFSLLQLTFLPAQEFSYPAIKPQAANVLDFIPKNWTLLDSVSGDLNKDGKKDFALVLQYKDSVTLFEHSDSGTDTLITQPRLLAILFHDSSRAAYHLAEQSNSFILNHDNPCLLDPLGSIQIEKGVLIINFSLFSIMGSWDITSTSYKFRYQSGQFALIGADYFSMNRATRDFEESSFNFLNHKWSSQTGNDNSGKKTKATWHTLETQELKTFKTFSKPYTWEVVRDIYL